MKALAVVGAITLACAYAALLYFVFWPVELIKGDWLSLAWGLAVWGLVLVTFYGGAFAGRSLNTDKEKK